MTPEQQYTLKDSRDGKTYTIAKYQVGNPGNYDIWMTQNLDLDLDAGITYTNEDTDIGYNTTTQQYDTAAWRPIRSTYSTTSTHVHSWCEGGTWYTEQFYCENNTPESYDPGNLYWNGIESDNSDWGAYYDSCDFSDPTPVCDQTKNPISTYVTTTSSTPQYHLGNFYNWAAAMATNDSSQFDKYDELVEQSICPAGWTLPRIDEGEDSFYSLWSQYGFRQGSINGNNKLWTSPLYFVAGGGFNGVLGAVGSSGFFWSPVSSGPNGAMSVDFDIDGGVYPSFERDKSSVDSVRCVARPVVSSSSGGGGPQ